MKLASVGNRVLANFCLIYKSLYWKLSSLSFLILIISISIINYNIVMLLQYFNINVNWGCSKILKVAQEHKSEHLRLKN